MQSIYSRSNHKEGDKWVKAKPRGRRKGKRGSDDGGGQEGYPLSQEKNINDLVT